MHGRVLAAARFLDDELVDRTDHVADAGVLLAVEKHPARAVGREPGRQVTDVVLGRLLLDALDDARAGLLRSDEAYQLFDVLGGVPVDVLEGGRQAGPLIQTVPRFVLAGHAFPFMVPSDVSSSVAAVPADAGRRSTTFMAPSTT
uniref:Uncharacterized protein n=1 Tax=Streptomyces rochei TaxID=1928 RepID=A0A0U3SRA5_STRRO|nr:hypothetical protein [Streptomyces rochei]